MLTFSSVIIVIFVNIEARVHFNAQVFCIFRSNRCQVALFNNVHIPSSTSIGKSILFTVRRLEERRKQKSERCKSQTNITGITKRILMSHEDDTQRTVDSKQREKTSVVSKRFKTRSHDNCLLLQEK